MKTLLLLMLAATFTLSGCALFDSLLGAEDQQVTNDAGQAVYIDAAGNETTDAVDPETGVANAPKTERVVTGKNATAVAGWLGLLGPWGALAGLAVTTASGVYAGYRNARNKGAKQVEYAKAAARFLAGMVEKIKEGDAIDADKNGRVDLDEIKEWVRRQGGKFTDPEYLRQLVIEANAALKV